MLLEEPHTPKRLQEADQRRRVGVAVRPPVGGRTFTSRLIHLPLPIAFGKLFFISYCAAIVVRIRALAQGVVYKCALLIRTHRQVMEHTFSWLSQSHRMIKDNDGLLHS
jgi:hypothetical protein